MNKTEMAKGLADKIAVPVATAYSAITAICEIILQEISKGSTVKLTGFGTFRQHTAKKKKGRNPQTGASIMIPETTSMKFKRAKAVKDFLN